MPKTRRLVVALLAAGVPLSACGGGGGGPRRTSCGDYRFSGSADKAWTRPALLPRCCTSAANR